jgi:hypothetical protein
MTLRYFAVRMEGTRQTRDYWVVDVAAVAVVEASSVGTMEGSCLDGDGAGGGEAGLARADALGPNPASIGRGRGQHQVSNFPDTDPASYLIPLPDHFEYAATPSPLSNYRSPGLDSIQTDLGSVLKVPERSHRRVFS